MSEGKKILATRGRQIVQIGSLFVRAFSGEGAAVGRQIATQAARERGREDIASAIDAEFDEEEETNR